MTVSRSEGPVAGVPASAQQPRRAASMTAGSSLACSTPCRLRPSRRIAARAVAAEPADQTKLPRLRLGGLRLLPTVGRSIVAR